MYVRVCTNHYPYPAAKAKASTLFPSCINDDNLRADESIVRKYNVVFNELEKNKIK